MGKTLTLLKSKLREALKKEGIYTPAKEFQIDIAAGYALSHKKLLEDIEILSEAIVRDSEDLDFIATLDESIKSLPLVADNYQRSLAALGLACTSIGVEEGKHSATPKPAAPTSDADALEILMSKVAGK